jgi:DnaJ-class molecular chaperone
MKDPYAMLGLRRGASAEEIKTSYRRLARELHPDRRPGDARAEERFKHVSAAYALLSDAETRAKYDRGEIDVSGTPKGRRASPGAHARRNPFDHFFRDRGAHAAIKVNGANVDYTLKIDFLEAARGAIKNVGMTNGKRLKVAIPPGTRSGQILRLRGQGMPGLGGGAAGDALVEITVEPHPAFRVDGDDVRAEIPVTLAEAILGGRVLTETIDGPVRVTIPEGSNTGTTLRLKGKGLAKDGNKRGDHFAVLKILLPARSDPELVEFIRAWSSKRPYSVRDESADEADPEARANPVKDKTQ